MRTTALVRLPLLVALLLAASPAAAQEPPAPPPDLPWTEPWPPVPPPPPPPSLPPPPDPLAPPPRPRGAPVDLAAAVSSLARAGRGTLEVPLGGGAEPLRFDLVLVAPGEGQVGIDPDDPTLPGGALRQAQPSFLWSTPRVSVRLTEGFLLGATEVTNGQYLALLEAAGVDPGARRRRSRDYLAHLSGNGASASHGGGGAAAADPAEPVRCVSWADAAEACHSLRALLALAARPGAWVPAVRLPTELEWEVAAAGTGPPRRFPWGDEPPAERDPFGLGRVLGPAGAAPRDRTPDGVLGLCGGVAEWCADPWEDDRWREAPSGGLTATPSAVRLTAPARSSGPMVVRGASFDTTNSAAAECAWRNGRAAIVRDPRIGFRLLVPLPPAQDREGHGDD